MASWHNYSDYPNDTSSTTLTVEKHKTHSVMSSDNEPETNEETSIEITSLTTNNGVSEVTHTMEKNSKVLSDAELSTRSDNARSTALSYKNRNNHSNIFGGDPLPEPTYGRRQGTTTPTSPTPTESYHHEQRTYAEKAYDEKCYDDDCFDQKCYDEKVYNEKQRDEKHQHEKQHEEKHYDEKQYNQKHDNDVQHEEKRSPRKDGNPVSGEGYGTDTVTNEIGAYRQHSNIPPGGFCSNIWYE